MTKNYLILILLLVTCCKVSSQTDREWSDVTYPMGLGRVSIGDNIGSVHFYEMGDLIMVDERRFLYYVPTLSLCNFVKRDLSVDQYQWSFALPINLAASWVYDWFLKGEDSDTLKTPDSKWKYLLFAPNCFVGKQIGHRTYFAYGGSTDYLFKSGGDQTPPGILFSPFVGVMYQAREAYETRERNFPELFALSIGPSYFWNFDGPSKFDSWMIRLSLIGGILD